MSKLDKTIKAMLDAAEELGYSASNIIVAVTNDYVKGSDGTNYQTHVGRTEDKDMGVLLGMLADDLRKETKFQSMCLFNRDEDCPACGSVRFGPMQKGDGSLRLFTFDECMDCGHIVGETPKDYEPTWADA